MHLSKAQAEIALDRHRFRVVNCGRRFGKTTLAIDQIKACAAYREARIAYIAPTFQQARDIAWEQLKKDYTGSGATINETRLEVRAPTVNGKESLIVLRGWESIETLRGQLFDLIVLDEVASMRNFWRSWEEVVRPTLTDRKGEVLFISTPKGFNHFYDLFNLQETDPDFKSFHFTSYDNPHIPADEIDKAKQQLTEDRFGQEYLADFRKTEGLVYKEFDRTRHVYTTATYHPVDRLVGIDWGWTNPAASHLIEKDSDRHYWISNEFYKTHQSTAQIIEHVSSLRPNKVYPDPAEPDRNEEARRAGLNVREVSKDLEAGISCLQELFKQNRIHIHSSCVNLIQELETYSYPEKKPNQNENEAPIKENDHALDEIRYVLYMQESRGSAQAFIHYSQSSMPNPMPTGLAPELGGKPKVAYTHIPRL
jgi:hypothetical protein